MRGLVVTPLPLPDPSRDLHGVFLRLRLFLHAISRLCSPVEMVHFVPAAQMELSRSGQLEADLSRFWGIPIILHLVARNEAPRTWQQMASAPTSLETRGAFRPFVGRAQREALERLLTKPTDFIFAHRLPAMVALSGHTRTPVFFDLDDIEHQVKLRAARSAGQIVAGWRTRIEIGALRAAEHRSLGLAARTFVCSAHDISVLAACGMDASRTIAIHNAVALPAKAQPLTAAKTILFLGNYGHAPNAEAAERLISRIWPQLRQSCPQARLVIAGASPELIPAWSKSPAGVEFTGIVEDLNALYARIRVVCCPIENGGGTRIKLIEAAGYGKAIVATAIAAEGLALVQGRDMLRADTDADIAAACHRLLLDDDMAQQMGESAGAVARSLHHPGDVVGQIERDLRAALAGMPQGIAEPGLPRAQRPKVAVPSAPAENSEVS